uniref:Truncated RTN2-A2 n=1 Tax=Homo sapiens TaxID=9606 RepID=Q7RTM9_HUMAN|nr:TPA_inf: truncated RTN2-A2 [Homo sapiens]
MGQVLPVFAHCNSRTGTLL